MNLLQLKQRLARRLGANSASLDSLTSSRYTDFLNEAHREVLSDAGMARLREDVITFDAVASQQRYALPTQGVARINRIMDTTNRWQLTERTLAWLRSVDANPPTGTPTNWIPLSYVQVQTQPSAACQVFAKSTSASDTTQTIYVEGMITGGFRRTASVTLTGTVAVSLSSSITNWIEIDKCYLSATAVGTVTLLQDSGSGTELSRIAIGDTYGQFFALLLYLTPASTITYTVDITRGIAEMSQDTDEPLIPDDFHDLLLDMAEAKELIKGDDPQRFAMVQEHMRKRRSDLRAWLFQQPSDGAPEARDQGSNLGAWFPSGRW